MTLFIWVFMYARAFRHIKLSQHYRDNRSIVMLGCKYIYKTKHEELGPQIGITRAVTTGYANRNNPSCDNRLHK